MASSWASRSALAISETLILARLSGGSWTSARDALIIQGMKQNVVDLRVARVLKVVQSEPSRRFTVRDLAKLAGASRASFVRLFRAATGESPQRWLRARRLEQAAALLVGSDETLAGIACLVGYVSEFALSRAFKRHYGVAPARYRQQSSLTLRCAA